MRSLRPMLLWLFAAMMVLSGPLARSVVVCVGAAGEARLEAADSTGRCLDENSAVEEHGHSNAESLYSTDRDCLGCADVAIAAHSFQFSSFAPESQLVLPPLLFDAAMTLCEVPADLVQSVRLSRIFSPPAVLTDIGVIRETVTLLI